MPGYFTLYFTKYFNTVLADTHDGADAWLKRKPPAIDAGYVPPYVRKAKPAKQTPAREVIAEVSEGAESRAFPPSFGEEEILLLVAYQDEIAMAYMGLIDTIQ